MAILTISMPPIPLDGHMMRSLTLRVSIRLGSLNALLQPHSSLALTKRYASSFHEAFVASRPEDRPHCSAFAEQVVSPPAISDTFINVEPLSGTIWNLFCMETFV